MSTKRDRNKLKFYLETGKRPTEEEFAEVVQSGINQIDDGLHAVDEKIGIGTDQPDEKLDIDGKVKVREDLLVKGHVIGDKADKNGNDDTLYLANYSAIGLHGKNKPNEAGNITLSANKANGASGKTVFNRFIGPGQGHAPSMLIDGDGKVGIGTTNPQNTLHVQNTANKSLKTGLRLSTGASDQRILVSDNNGDASWRDASFITSGLWQQNGNNIHNGNPGNVGVGINNPSAKLHVDGFTRMESRSGKLEHIGTSDDKASHFYHFMKDNPATANQQRNIRYRHIFGGSVYSNSDNDTGISIESYREKNGGIWSAIGTKRGQLYIGAEKTIDFIPGGVGASGRTGWTDQNQGWFLRQKAKIGSMTEFGAYVNPNNGQKEYQLEVFGDTNFKGNIYVNDYKPIWVRNYFFRLSDDIDDGVYLRDRLGNKINNSKYGAAIVSGFKSSAAKLAPQAAGLPQSNPDFQIEAFTYLDGNKDWMLRADFASHQMKNILGNVVNDHEEWDLTITFIAKELVQYDGNTNNSN